MTVFADAVKKDIDESIGHFSVGEPEVVVAKDISDLSLMEHHSDKRARG
jgi:GTP cyclohydrolase I